MIESKIAVRTENAATSAEREQRPADRAEVVHHPLEAVGAPVRLGRRRIGEERVPRRDPQPSRGPRAHPEERHLQQRRRGSDQPRENRDARVAADRRRPPPGRIVCEGSSEESRDPREAVGDALDDAEGGRRASERGDEPRKERGRDLMPEVR